MINKSTFTEVPASKLSLAKRKTVYGFGINNADYNIARLVNGKLLVCPFYRKWCNMLKRCYSKEYQKDNRAYLGCSVCKEWLLFSNFKKWMCEREWIGKELDKDIIYPGNKIYSPNNCCLIPKSLNNLLVIPTVKERKYPLGVFFNGSNFCTHVSYNGKIKHIGSFPNALEASKAYIKEKSKIILQVAIEQKDKRISDGLKLHSKQLKENYLK